MTGAVDDTAATADELRRRALGDIAAGRIGQAIRLLQRAIGQVSGAPFGVAARRRVHHACLLTLAVARLHESGATEALGVLAQAQDLAGDDAELLTRGRAQLALVLGRMGDLAEAEATFRLVTEHLDVFTPQERCSILLNRGMTAVERARPDEAVVLFREAAATAEAAGLPRQRFMALHNAGYAAHLTGDLPAALTGMDAADAIDADVFRGPALFDRGRVLHEAGLLGEALEVLGEAALACGRRGHHLLRGEIQLETAKVLLLLGDPTGAAASARSACRRFQVAGSDAWARRGRAALAAARLAQGRYGPDLAKDVEELAARGDADGDTRLTAEAACLAAELAARRGEPELGRAALARYPQADLGLAAQLTRAHAVVAVDLAAGERAGAGAALRTAAALVESSQAGSASLDSRAARAVLGSALADQDLGLALEDGSPAAVVAALERWSAAGRGLPAVRPPSDPAVAALVQSLRTVLRQLRDEPGDPRAADREQEAARLRRRISAAGHATAQPASEAPRGPDVTGLLDRVREAGRDLWWLFGWEGTLWVAGTSGEADILRPVGALSPVREAVRRLQADLRALPLRPPGPLRAAVQASLSAGLEQLASLVPRPGRPVVVVGSAETAGIPWGLLPPLRGVPVTVARAASEWLVLRRETTGVATVMSGPDLVYAEAERTAVATQWARVGTVVDAGLATTAAATAALEAPGVVHVAAHGRHHLDSPLFSSLRLSDGDLLAYELQHRRVRADHVVLSACDVGAVTVRPGGETLGFAGALVSLGVASVVASVAPVPDEAAADLMARHHQGLARGLESDAALAAACERVPAAATFIATGSTWRLAPTSACPGSPSPAADAGRSRTPRAPGRR